MNCWDVDPSNGLGAALDQSSNGPSLVLGDGSTIDTSTGAVVDENGNRVRGAVDGDDVKERAEDCISDKIVGPKVRPVMTPQAPLTRRC